MRKTTGFEKQYNVAAAEEEGAEFFALLND